jgi:hypothetical protein
MNLFTELRAAVAFLIALCFLIPAAASAGPEPRSPNYRPGRYIGFSGVWNDPLSADLRVRRSHILHLDANIPVVCRNKTTSEVHSYSLNLPNDEFAQALPFSVDSRGNFWGELWIDEQEHGGEEWMRLQLRVTGRFRNGRNKSHIFFNILDYETNLEVCDHDSFRLRLNRARSS